MLQLTCTQAHGDVRYATHTYLDTEVMLLDKHLVAASLPGFNLRQGQSAPSHSLPVLCVRATLPSWWLSCTVFECLRHPSKQCARSSAAP
eukprot:1154801-Pelagomonas_calceolata.AAC.2